ncbi:MAG: CoA transferase subunit A [Acidobacteriota bacterium]
MSKQLGLSEALAEWVPNGATLLMGAGLEALIPFSAAHELIRQGRRDLTLVAPISDMLIDQLVGAGLARKIVAAWVGNVSAGSGYNFRRAVEEGVPEPVEVIDHSNLTLALALHAAALGVPFLPTFSTLGTDLLASNPDLGKTACPFTGESMVAVKALAPDVAILPVQRADPEGNSHVWGNLGVISDAARAAKRVVVLAEEIVSAKVIEGDPNRTVIPGFLVSAVVHEPLGCHPSPCHGYYGRDHAFFSDYHDRTCSREGFLGWLDDWVLRVKDRKEYLARLGRARAAALREECGG